jgi:hypothetical protein
MARVHEVVHHLRTKPQHVRENIAIGTAGGITLVVAIGWLFATAASGTFAWTDSPTADPQVHEAVAEGSNQFSDLLGAAGAVFGATSSPAEITIVDTQVRSTLDQPSVSPEATVIHF